MLRLRPFNFNKDFEELKNWSADERVHAMWCANLIPFPIEEDGFKKTMNDFSERFGDSPFVATTEDGKLAGFFCYSLNLENNEGMLKFVMINPSMRNKGFGKEMLQLAAKYSFEITKADSLQLNVFPENIGAKKCYEKVGFTERKTDLNAFKYKDESWGRCNMVLKLKSEENFSK